MANLSLSFLLLGTLMCQHSWAARKKMKVVARHAAGHDARSMDKVEDFLKAVTEMGPQGQAAGALAKNLEDGVQATIVSSEFNTGEDGSLTLEVVHSQVNQGEIATPSKVPVMWTLDPTTTYKFKFEDGKWRLSVTGIKLLPFAEGREMYVESKVQEQCATNELMAAKVKCEREALYQWYQGRSGQYNKKYSKKDYLDYAKHPEHKLARALTSMYGSTSTYYAVRAGGADAWSKIVYSLVTIAPIQIDHFLFLDNVEQCVYYGEPDCFEKVEMAMVSHPALEGEYGGQDLAAFSGLDFYVKNGAEFDEKNFENQRSKGEMFARSGMNFGALAVKGKNQDILNGPVRGGTAEYIINFAKPCRATGDAADKNNDPTDECRGDKGRVFWH